MIKQVETLEDANECDKLLNKLILDEKQYDNTIDEKFKVNNYFANIFRDEENLLLVKIIENKVVAYIFAKKLNNNVSKGIGYLIDGLYVESEYRKQGIATDLINEITKICAMNNGEYIDINVMYKNDLAKKLYKSLKFQELRITLRKELN